MGLGLEPISVPRIGQGLDPTRGHQGDGMLAGQNGRGGEP